MQPLYAIWLSRFSDAMNKYLWATGSAGADHYVTQLNPDGTTRDHIDYDSNLLAVAFGVAPEDRIQPLLKRVDSGNCTHARLTYTCEIYYNGQEDCYIKGGTTCGDSVVTIGRIGWADAHARKRVGDQNTFDQILIPPIQGDLLADTWLYERYDCEANNPSWANPYYFEYPSVTAMLLREIRYGINIGLINITIDPLGPTSFEYHLNTVQVSYSNSSTSISVPGEPNGKRQYVIKDLIPDITYSISSQGNTAWCNVPSVQQNTDRDGTLIFSGPVGPMGSQCEIAVQRA